jgi:ribonucleoside-diphosphate reductase alpha chain
MVAIDIKHGIEPIRVTDGHPIYSIRGIKKGNTVKRIRKKLGSGDICPEWVAAGHLTDQDFIGITVPCDFVQVEGFTEEDARLYGMMLADGHISIKKGGYKECGVAFNTNKKGEDFQFLTNYLAKKNIHYWITESSESFCTQVGWTYNTSIPISHEDLYDKEGKKRISSRLMHLPRPFALQMIRGMIDADGGIYRKNEVYFYNTSTKLVEGFRYQILKFGVPTSGNIRTRHYDREIIRRSGSVDRIQGTTTSYDIRIPAFKELADIFNIPSVTKFNWFTWNNILFTRVKSVEEIANPPEYVYDLKVEGLENYTTTKRKGAGCAYLEVWHLDVEDFLELRKNTGDDRRRCHDMNTALWICDEFMLAVKEERDWYLLDPHECPDLHDLYGQEFSKAYAQYCEMAENGELENFAKMPAKDLWKKCLKALFETGHPWITFKDPSNIRYSNKHAGVVHSSNLCTEILLHTKPTVYDEGELTEIGETAVCNLASINLANHVKVRTIDWKKLQKTVEVAVRGLDNVIDLNFYPTEEARNSNLKNRPVGLGVMGTHDVLHKLNINYDSQEAIDLCGKIQEFISLHAIKTSALLAKEKGSYPTFGGSEWDKGNFPIDTYCDLRNQRVTKPCVEEDSSLYETLDEWDSVRQLVADYGMRNSNVMAIAPTATISYIQGCSQSIEPDYSALYVYSTLSGEFTMVNEHFVALAKKKGIWSQELIDALKSVDGDVTALVDLSDDLKEEFKNAFDVSYETLIKAAAARQRWIDMGQSLNLYNKYESLKYLNDMYMLAWEECLKTTYYLRSKAATRLEKSTVSADKNSEDESIISKPSACSILDPGCESCQ